MTINWHVYRDAGNRWLALSAGLIVIGLWAAVAVLIRNQTDITPLHYTIYFGIDLTGPANRLWSLPIFATVSWISHLLISQMNTTLPWARMWLIISLLIEILLAAALFSLSFVLAGS